MLPEIRPVTDLAKKTREISDYVHRTNEPVILTKNGNTDMVIMSADAFEKILIDTEVYCKLKEALREAQNPETELYTKEEIMKSIAKLDGERNGKV